MPTAPDPEFRPADYFAGLTPMQELLAAIPEVHRRRHILAALEAGDDLPEGMLDPRMDPEVQQALERLHPRFMGGAYLPGRHPLEVEIAQVCLASTTWDVVSLRARPLPEGGIGYRIVDEYGTDLHLPIHRSDLPLTLGEAFRQVRHASGFNDGHAGLLLDALAGGGRDPDFVTVDSVFYPDLQDLCAACIREHLGLPDPVEEDWD